jgi:hypothetical protein
MRLDPQSAGRNKVSMRPNTITPIHRNKESAAISWQFRFPAAENREIESSHVHAGGRHEQDLPLKRRVEDILIGSVARNIIPVRKAST